MSMLVEWSSFEREWEGNAQASISSFLILTCQDATVSGLQRQLTSALDECDAKQTAIEKLTHELNEATAKVHELQLRCVCVCGWVCACACVCVCACVCECACDCEWRDLQNDKPVHYLFTQSHTYLYIYIYIYIYARTHTHIHTHIYIYARTHTHTHLVDCGRCGGLEMECSAHENRHVERDA